jgi:hypothetical protein
MALSIAAVFFAGRRLCIPHDCCGANFIDFHTLPKGDHPGDHCPDREIIA